MKKIAILISGYLRCFDINLEKFLNNFKDYNVDIYIHKTLNECNDKYYNNNLNWSGIKKKLNPKFISIFNDLKINNNTTKNNILNQFYKYYFLNNVKNMYEKIENFSYDIVIKWRPDILIHKKFALNINKNIVYLPEDSKIDISKLRNKYDNYICDIIAYGDSETMNKYFNFYMQLNNLIEKYGICQETLMFHYLNNNNIKYEEQNINYTMILSLCNIISISGNSGSGKTALTRMLTKDISNSFILECDRYHKWERGDKNWEKYTHLNPEANYLTKMNKDVFDLKIGKKIYQVDYDHKNGKFTSKETIESKNTVIVCGLHALYNTKSNINIFMDTMKDLNIFWKIKRDTKKRGYSVEKVFKSIQKRSADYKKYILPQINKADIIINFYTDDNISFDDLERNYKIKLNLFIKKKYNIFKLWKFIKQDIHEITEEMNYYKLNINNENYYKIIKYIIKNISSINNI